MSGFSASFLDYICFCLCVFSRILEIAPMRRRAIQSLTLVFIASVLCSAAPGAVGAERLRMGGAGSGLGLLHHLSEAYVAEHPDLRVEILPSLGTSGGISALAGGVLELAVGSRPLKPEEIDKGLREVAAARTPFVLATSRLEPESIDAAAVAAAFGAQQSAWPDGTPIRLVLRSESESDTRLLEEFFPGMPAALAAARLRPEIPIAATDQDTATAAEGMEGSLTGATLVLIVTEDRALRTIPIDGAEPTLANLESGRYPYAKTLHFIVSETASPAVEDFARFLTSAAADPIMRAAGILPAGL
jgi:phosphate transport system substrate-binding protein